MLYRDTFVLFADMLGFADLVEAEGEELNELNPIFQGIEVDSPSPAENLLGYRFINFHKCVETARGRLQKSRFGTAIVFSDSAFFQVDTIDSAVTFARELMYNLVENGIPCRMGLARGSFRFLRSVTDSSEQVAYHMSQFLGTGVVRAHMTERCGVPGLRVLLHPNLEDLLDKQAMRIVPLKENLGRPAVMSEVNYLEPESKQFLGPLYFDVLPFDSLARMAGEAGETFQYHYVATYHAMNVMREQLGREPYPWGRYMDRDAWEKEHGIQEGG